MKTERFAYILAIKTETKTGVKLSIQMVASLKMENAAFSLVRKIVIGHVVGGVRGYCYDVIYKNPRYDPSWSLYGVVVNDYKGNVEVVGNVIDNNDLLIS